MGKKSNEDSPLGQVFSIIGVVAAISAGNS